MTKIQISPNASIVLIIIYAVLSGLSVPMLNALGFTANAPIIYAWAGAIGGVISMILKAFSSNDPGILAPKDPAVVTAAKEVAALPKDASIVEIASAKKMAVNAVTNHDP